VTLQHDSQAACCIVCVSERRHVCGIGGIPKHRDMRRARDEFQLDDREARIDL